MCGEAQAAPVVAALSKGPSASREDAVSGLYGGAGGERAVTDEVYSAIGSVRTHFPAFLGVTGSPKK